MRLNFQVLTLYVWAQVADEVLPGSPLGLANEASNVQQEVDASPWGNALVLAAQASEG